jgi:molecular chaperone GrpE (heat shock protein)
MNDVANWKVPKWIFLISDVLLLALAYFIVWKSPHPIGKWEIIACFASAALGTMIGTLPFILDYRAMGNALEVNALGAVAEKIQNLEKLAAQISSATNQWAGVQETVQGNSDKTVAVTKEIADRMAEEIRLFSEFMKKMNDSEKTTLRLEVEKLRRGELEWLQVLVTILDHVFALHAAAMRSGDVKFAAPITTFQNVCRDTARRLGLMPFAAEPDKPFDAERHQVAGSKEMPPASAVVAETVGSGYTFQGRLLRPALVRLRDGNAPAETEPEKPASAAPPVPEKAGDGFSLESPE